MKRPVLVNNEIYHVFNRGVEKRIVFDNDKDRVRFIHDLYEMNDALPTLNNRYWLPKKDQYLEIQLPHTPYSREREKLVDIFAFCLMPNHYHLLMRQIKEGGISKFMQKLGTAYTNYFNLKNERVGPLFQGRFKAVSVQEDRHIRHLFNYIHVNPLDLFMPEWQENKLKNFQKASEFLLSYRWSSYPDYIGKKNFPSVINKSWANNIFGSTQAYRENLKEWLLNMKNDTNEPQSFIIKL